MGRRGRRSAGPRRAGVAGRAAAGRGREADGLRDGTGLRPAVRLPVRHDDARRRDEPVPVRVGHPGGPGVPGALGILRRDDGRGRLDRRRRVRQREPVRPGR
ncbi:hypothetical protein KCH_34670 [Kitasatospora cheerisanensis KCTC 2395]|uniref:Uncharacterized protein n=1 Tax=Kitasatospora cheerisanensis KCTC 2395 TaxID=1348663 RepID=A0A066Z444_9ACTN|nr:hypothetical protein KCH_34670 [Kitasatospora cheerisanensis KCTC 2395]